MSCTGPRTNTCAWSEDLAIMFQFLDPTPNNAPGSLGSQAFIHFELMEMHRAPVQDLSPPWMSKRPPRAFPTHTSHCQGASPTGGSIRLSWALCLLPPPFYLHSLLCLFLLMLSGEIQLLFISFLSLVYWIEFLVLSFKLY
ncbi:hypothetical protein SLEP1_g3505 [Rubroshorea leprosula]|uniref:Uncharacterized protein n=1 Tax=Rubroshorea leprosula TaxID=152421 RepID=A0AAV5HL59_9ROSI|nr:hypothetical protein SLEP1_g3505 [Rubroshorea leprosula]